VFGFGSWVPSDLDTGLGPGRCTDGRLGRGGCLVGATGGGEDGDVGCVGSLRGLVDGDWMGRLLGGRSGGLVERCGAGRPF
jgi:hypothetical protein